MANRKKTKPKLKLKTHRGAAKRFKITANGKVKHKKSNMSHILSGESRNHKRNLNRRRRRRAGDQF